jgi:PIN domain nuclease of toxin-antitoxin system
LRLLLDTHVLLWAAARPERLSEKARAALEEPENPLYFSAASAAELAIKIAIGKLTLPDPLPLYLHATLAKLSIDELPISIGHAAALESLPMHHRDPFDRFLITQARAEGLTLVTADREIARYEVPLLW